MSGSNRTPDPAAGPPADDAPVGVHLAVELEVALLRELTRTWSELNASFFKGALTIPVFRLIESTQLLGRWHAHRRTLDLSLPLIVRSPWGSVVEVLKHEMAHQYVDEILEADDETAHGPAFQDVCERMGVHAGATGLPAPSMDEDPERSRLLKRVAGLLALADSPNLNEAKAAAAAAQRLMLKHNIELGRQPDRQGYAFRHLGRPSGRVPESDHILAGILAEHFFVEAIWVPAYRPEDGKRGSVLEISGTAENLKIASYVHEFLRGTAARLWQEHCRAQGVRSNRDRRTFLAGVMEGFRERLQEEKTRCREQGLVWVGDADLQRYHRQRHPHVRQVRLQGHECNEARAHGRAAGRRIVLRRALGDEAPADANAQGAGRPRRLSAARSPARPKR